MYRTIELSIHGYIMGKGWYNQDCYKVVHYKFKISSDPIQYYNSHIHNNLYDTLLYITGDSDFKNAKMSPDSYLEIVRQGGNYRHIKYFDLQSFPSLKDFISTDYPELDEF